MIQKKIPLRKCIGCNEMYPKKELIRIVNTPEDDVVLDMTGRKNGRGAYLCRNIGCLEAAIKTKAINRAFKKNISEDVYSKMLEELGGVCNGQ